MPKETINCMLEHREVSIGSDNEPTATKQLAREINVHWYKQTPDGALGGVFLGIVNQDEEKVDAQLSRQEINRLIRVLRHARDGAFGSDA